jgi:hypothetical protein
MPMNPYSGMASPYSFFGHPPNNMFPEGMQFFPPPVDPVAYVSFISYSLTSIKISIFSLVITFNQDLHQTKCNILV